MFKLKDMIENDAFNYMLQIDVKNIYDEVETLQQELMNGEYYAAEYTIRSLCRILDIPLLPRSEQINKEWVG